MKIVSQLLLNDYLHTISHNSANIVGERMEIEPQINLSVLDTVTKNS